MRVPANIEGLYVHVPFCDGKCFYCAFYSVPYSVGRADEWIQAVRKEARQLTVEHGRIKPKTVYFGGGTPTLLSASQVRALCDVLREELFSCDWSPEDVEEWTIESNPAGATSTMFRQWREVGVNRVSVGVQSLRDASLELLGRRHRLIDIESCIEAVHESGIVNWGVDLIACVPGLDAAVWCEMLRRVVQWGPKHVSVYALTAEEGSVLLDAVCGGGIQLLDSEQQLDMLILAEDVLCAAGYERYEISNYSRPGFACRHNLACWRGRNYLGLGCAAASRIGRRRWTNRANLDDYIASLQAGTAPVREEDRLDTTLDAVERLIFGLRLAEGVDLSVVKRESGCETSVLESWGRTLSRLVREGLVEGGGEKWRLTRRGRELADHVAVELMP